ncbi:ABC transporter substrate-binding protein [Bradyrhizobium sp. WSM 1738]|uniref:TAXI family TRAP transporter solute-binding subunit n=1 Tax=Bradyrhizobium hereditatis TaxID=2821405 RepID=UPI001CE2C5C4|nr:TAXI family TRAP transporter solute-binding subunit [Bradyrhizobium hereditatis]MCA6114529.1 ABC transporter substrate-binding protein [Bradyrhizobium hereditatis]
MSDTNDNSARSRRRRRRRSYALLILAVGMLVFCVAAGTLYYVLRPTTLRIAVGPANSEDQKLVQLMAQTFAREGSPVRLSVVTTEGTTESIALFTDGKADLAVARGDLNLPTNAESVAILRKNVVVLWAPSGLPAKGSRKQPTAKIKSLDELAGHRVGVIGRTQANVTLLRGILKESGINPDKVTISQFATNQINEMAKDQSVDAYMAVGPLKSKITVDAIAATAAARGEPKFLPIEVAEAIAKKNPIYESEEIPASIFGSSPQRPEDKVDTVAVNHLIIAPKSLSDTVVAAFARQLFTNRQQLAREMPTASQIEKPDTEKDAALPAHAGAAAYIDGNERTFLEKYTDYIWFAVLILSGLGSAGAWFKHYWNKDEREQYLAHRDHLLELIARVRKAETPEDLVEMQNAADGMLRETLECYDDGTVEESDLSVIALALEQFHHAVSDRRAVLAGAGAADSPRMRVG